MVTVAPCPGWLSTPIVPLWASTIREAIGIPRPVPRSFVEKYRSKIRSRSSGVIPGPRVANDDLRFIVRQPRGEFHDATLARRLDGVGRDVQKDLAHLVRVESGGHRPAPANPQRHAPPGRDRRQFGTNRLGQAAQIARRPGDDRRPRKLQELGDDSIEPPGLPGR